MKKILPFLLAIGLFEACSHEPEPNHKVTSTEVKRDTLLVGQKICYMEATTDTNYIFPKIDRYSETDSAALLNIKNAWRRGDTLFVKCDNQEVQLVNNLKEDGDFRAYRFLLYNPEIDYYVIHCSFYEGSGMLLINKKTGKKIETLGIPAVSPGKKFFACGNCDLIARYDVSGIELYEKQGDSYNLLGTREIAEWGPEQMGWKNDTSLLIQGLEQKSDTSHPVRMFRFLYIK